MPANSLSSSRQIVAIEVTDADRWFPVRLILANEDTLGD